MAVKRMTTKPSAIDRRSSQERESNEVALINTASPRIEWVPIPLGEYCDFFTEDGRWEIKGTNRDFRILQLNGWSAITPASSKTRLSLKEAVEYVEREYREAKGHGYQ